MNILKLSVSTSNWLETVLKRKRDNQAHHFTTSYVSKSKKKSLKILRRDNNEKKHKSFKHLEYFIWKILKLQEK